jgi:tRNA 5-methylaminomethyl-2-thiouridine biosynthesis bifunctional protein
MSDQAKKKRSPYQLDTAALSWKQGDIPEAIHFDDVYFSLKHGLEESDYIYLQHNQLQQRWQQLNSSEVFTIGETGFGTGLNFLAAWQLWQQTAPTSAKLHFISAEKYPLCHQDLSRALAAWPQLSSLARPLLEQYPQLTPGSHLLHFDNNRVSLQLLLGDATQGFEQLRYSDHPQWQNHNRQPINAWFLDGFTPSKNPDLWHDELYSLIADLSAAGTTVATFTAASDVRRGLIAQGFKIDKAKGYGGKREMLAGYFDPRTTQGSQEKTNQDKRKGIKAPWYIHASTPKLGKHVAIIGGGLAGTSSAYAMAKRGWKVTLIERANKLAQGASGNPQGMLYTKLSAEAGTLNQFTLSSYLYALRFYQQWQQRNKVSKKHLDLCGVLQLATSEKEQQLSLRLQKSFARYPQLVRFMDAAQASSIAGVPLDFPGWFFPQAGWVSPRELCHSLSQHPLIDIAYNQEVLELNYLDERWHITDKNHQTVLSADAVIIANSRDALQFEQTSTLPSKTIRGQITLLESKQTSASLNTVICHEGYITPAINGIHSLGATFDNGDTDTSVRSKDHRRNLESLYKAAPSMLANRDKINSDLLQGRVGLRCTSPDYLPMIGPVPNYQHFLEDYAVLRKNAHSDITTVGKYHPNLYVNIAHGSRGLTSTPLCSEIIASTICEQPAPLPRHLITALNPARFIIRDLIRNKV